MTHDHIYLILYTVHHTQFTYEYNEHAQISYRQRFRLFDGKKQGEQNRNETNLRYGQC